MTCMPTAPARRFNPLRAAMARARGFGRDRRGATAVEFALIALPFFALIFAIIETALCFFAGQALETALMNASRAIRTGQAQSGSVSAADFKTSVCSYLTYMFNCSSNLYINVQTFSSFSSITLTTPVDANGNLATTGYTYDAGSGGEIVVIRAYYEWPVFVNRLGNNLANEPDGKHLLTATVAFQNEPFPW
jgi:Flp pilus assembly protein TadG